MPKYVRRNDLETFVLVHGGWAGGWQWQKLSPVLIRGGHRVYAPTLTGLGERKHLEVAGGIRLTTHIEDVANTILYEDLTGITLVGFSYGGMVATAIADRLSERVRNLVYLDAFVPRSGQSLFDLFGPGITRSLTAAARDFSRGSKVPYFESDDDRLEDQPILTGRENLFFHEDRIKAFGPVYIECTEKSPEWTFTPILQGIAREAQRRGWRILRIESDHFPMVRMPERLAEALLSAVEEGGKV
ncbi:MAG: alpha/beta fold hydrolase [bacterium]